MVTISRFSISIVTFHLPQIHYSCYFPAYFFDLPNLQVQKILSAIIRYPLINKYQIRLYDSTVLTLSGTMNIAIVLYVPS
jgi:hypothetical protein